jgi:hypothetical protein
MKYFSIAVLFICNCSSSSIDLLQKDIDKQTQIITRFIKGYKKKSEVGYTIEKDTQYKYKRCLIEKWFSKNDGEYTVSGLYRKTKSDNTKVFKFWPSKFIVSDEGCFFVLSQKNDRTAIIVKFGPSGKLLKKIVIDGFVNSLLYINDRKLLAVFTGELRIYNNKLVLLRQWSKLNVTKVHFNYTSANILWLSGVNLIGIDLNKLQIVIKARIEYDSKYPITDDRKKYFSLLREYSHPKNGCPVIRRSSLDPWQLPHYGYTTVDIGYDYFGNKYYRGVVPVMDNGKWVLKFSEEVQGRTHIGFFNSRILVCDSSEVISPLNCWFIDLRLAADDAIPYSMDYYVTKEGIIYMMYMDNKNFIIDRYTPFGLSK